MNARAGFGAARPGSAVSAAAPASIPRRPAFAGSPVPFDSPLSRAFVPPRTVGPDAGATRRRSAPLGLSAPLREPQPALLARVRRSDAAPVQVLVDDGSRAVRSPGDAGFELDATWRDWGRESWRRCWRASPPRRRGAAVDGARRRRCGRGVTVWSRHRDRGARRPGSRAPVCCPIARRLDASYLLYDRFEPIGLSM